MERRGVISSFKWFLPVFATRRGEGEGVSALWICLHERYFLEGRFLEKNILGLIKAHVSTMSTFYVHVALGFFYRELSATGSCYWLPAPLGWKLAYAGNTKTVENNRNWAELLLHDVYFIRSKDPQIHNNHGCKTTINWFSRTCNESKTTLY